MLAPILGPPDVRTSGFSGLQAKHAWPEAGANSTGVTSPIAVPQVVWTTALALFGLLALARLLTSIAGLTSRRWSDVTAELGPATLEEEINCELADVEERSRFRDRDRERGDR